MKGTMRERKLGVYELTVELHRDLNGKRHRRLEAFHGTEAEARVRLELLAQETERQRAGFGRVGDPNVLVQRWLQIWMNDDVLMTCKIKTQERYQSAIDLHLAPRVGHIQLRRCSANTSAGCSRNSNITTTGCGGASETLRNAGLLR